MSYFESCTTVEQIKQEYRKLAMQMHPDVGGSTEAMQALNQDYEAALRCCDGQTSQGSDGREHTYRYDQGKEREIIEKIDQLLQLQMNDAEIWLIGLWIWIEGNTKPYKDGLKELGCRWSNKHTAWYWRREEDRTWRSSGKDLSGIAATYGASKITRKGESNILSLA